MWCQIVHDIYCPVSVTSVLLPRPFLPVCFCLIFSKTEILNENEAERTLFGELEFSPESGSWDWMAQKFFAGVEQKFLSLVKEKITLLVPNQRRFYALYRIVIMCRNIFSVTIYCHVELKLRLVLLLCDEGVKRVTLAVLPFSSFGSQNALVGGEAFELELTGEHWRSVWRHQGGNFSHWRAQSCWRGNQCWGIAPTVPRFLWVVDGEMLFDQVWFTTPHTQAVNCLCDA